MALGLCAEHKHNFHFVIIFDLQWQFLISKNKNTHSLLRMSIKMLREEEKFKKKPDLAGL